MSVILLFAVACSSTPSKTTESAPPDTQPAATDSAPPEDTTPPEDTRPPEDTTPPEDTSPPPRHVPAPRHRRPRDEPPDDPARLA
jgi:hypothetical protein